MLVDLIWQCILIQMWIIGYIMIPFQEEKLLVKVVSSIISSVCYFLLLLQQLI